MSKLGSEMIQPRARNYIFCSVFQFGLWEKILSKKWSCRTGCSVWFWFYSRRKEERDSVLWSKNDFISLHACWWIIPMQHELYSIHILLKSPSTFGVWGLIGRRFWLNWAFRTMEMYPLRSHGERTTWIISAGLQQRGFINDKETSAHSHSLQPDQRDVVWMKYAFNSSHSLKNSRGPFWWCHCYIKDLHVAIEVSSLCWVRDWHRLFQRIISCGCGGVHQRNSQ